ncbi:MAG: glycosyltransferase family 4 protein [Vicingaceae bacterium]
MQKVLIITYYWPPSGGAGVQRWLKLSKYLAQLNLEIHILTVDEHKASYMQLDESLSKDIDSRVIVHKTDSFEVNKLYSKLVGKKNVPTSGFSNVDNSKFSQRFINAIRSNFFIPDPRIGWKKYAVKKGIELIDKYNITTVITTSPPHSTQLIGLALKKKRTINWLVDFRDPWTDIYYYKLLNHSFLSAKKDAKLEREVIEACDKIITVSEGFKSLFLAKSNTINEEKIKVIPNGYDKSDFNDKQHQRNAAFTITYTGTMSVQYDPFSFFDVVESLARSNKKIPIKLKIIGSISKEIESFLRNKSIPVEFIPTVPHNEVHRYQKEANLLLLVIPNTDSAQGITPGKLFEYIATKNKVIALGPTDSDVNRILHECNSGSAFRRSQVMEMKAFIQELIDLYAKNAPVKINENALLNYSRENQAAKIAKLIT